jgi:hypothetical protein
VDLWEIGDRLFRGGRKSDLTIEFPKSMKRLLDKRFNPSMASPIELNINLHSKPKKVSIIAEINKGVF